MIGKGGRVLAGICICGVMAATAGARQSTPPNAPSAASSQTPATASAPDTTGSGTATTKPTPAATGLIRNDPFVVVASVARPMVKKHMTLTYPPDAIAQGIAGVVKLEILVSREGNVIAVRKVSGPKLLADAAQTGVSRSQYEPMTLDGKPVYMATTIRIEFLLDKTKTPPVPGARELVGTDEDAQDAAMITADRPFAGRDPNVPLDDERKAVLEQVQWNVKAAKMIHHVDPIYPDVLKREGVQGSVVLRAIIRKDGTVGDITYISGPPQLKLNAIDAVKQWRYEPTLLGDQPVEVDTTITVTFALGARAN